MLLWKKEPLKSETWVDKLKIIKVNSDCQLNRILNSLLNLMITEVKLTWLLNNPTPINKDFKNFWVKIIASAKKLEVHRRIWDCQLVKLANFRMNLKLSAMKMKISKEEFKNYQIPTKRSANTKEKLPFFLRKLKDWTVFLTKEIRKSTIWTPKCQKLTPWTEPLEIFKKRSPVLFLKTLICQVKWVKPSKI